MKPTEYQLLPENRLITLLNGGDEQAFAELFHRYHHFLVSFADRLTRDKDESNDLIQEVFIRAWKHRERFDYSKILFNYLKVSVRHAFLNRERSKAHHTAFKEELANYLSQGYEHADGPLAEKELIARALQLLSFNKTLAEAGNTRIRLGRRQYGGTAEGSIGEMRIPGD